jgi:hypothetical protein
VSPFLPILVTVELLSCSYLDLLGTFRKLVSLKKSEIVNARNRTKTGLDKVAVFVRLGFEGISHNCQLFS